MSKYYNQTYVDYRKSFIPEAEEYANRTEGVVKKAGEQTSEEYAALWNAAFHGKMRSLWESR